MLIVSASSENRHRSFDQIVSVHLTEEENSYANLVANEFNGNANPINLTEEENLRIGYFCEKTQKVIEEKMGLSVSFIFDKYWFYCCSIDSCCKSKLVEF